jgi:hypothetical protein
VVVLCARLLGFCGGVLVATVVAFAGSRGAHPGGSKDQSHDE